MQRYSVSEILFGWGNYCTHEFVLYSDAQAALAEKDRELAEAKGEIERLSELLWGSRCVHCGEIVGKDKKNQDIADDVLRAHIKSCPKHPLAAANTEIAALRKRCEAVSKVADAYEDAEPGVANAIRYALKETDNEAHKSK